MTGEQNQTNDQVEFKITDQGVGLQQKSLKGEMFSQLEVKNNVNQNGIGFGLAITKILLENIHGEIRI